MLTWNKQKPIKPGWYWMLNPNEEPGLPTIVQIVGDWETGRSVALVPASSPKKPTIAVVDLQEFEAIWAGPIELPAVLEQAA
jgi:hypothetical protein